MVDTERQSVKGEGKSSVVRLGSTNAKFHMMVLRLIRKERSRFHHFFAILDSRNILELLRMSCASFSGDLHTIPAVCPLLPWRRMSSTRL